VSEFPQKDFYKINEVCQYTDTQPYVLRFWESEFPQLKPEKSGNGQVVYSREAIELVRRIKRLLHEEECTLESARRELEGEPKPRRGRAKARSARKSPEPDEEPQTVLTQQPVVDGIPRQRYQDAIEEIEVLRLQLKEAEKQQRKAEAARDEAYERAETHRACAARAGERIEQLLESLS